MGAMMIRRMASNPLDQRNFIPARASDSPGALHYANTQVKFLIDEVAMTGGGCIKDGTVLAAGDRGFVAASSEYVRGHLRKYARMHPPNTAASSL